MACICLRCLEKVSNLLPNGGLMVITMVQSVKSQFKQIHDGGGWSIHLEKTYRSKIEGSFFDKFSEYNIHKNL